MFLATDGRGPLLETNKLVPLEGGSGGYLLIFSDIILYRIILTINVLPNNMVKLPLPTVGFSLPALVIVIMLVLHTFLWWKGPEPNSRVVISSVDTPHFIECTPECMDNRFYFC